MQRSGLSEPTHKHVRAEVIAVLKIACFLCIVILTVAVVAIAVTLDPTNAIWIIAGIAVGGFMIWFDSKKDNRGHEHGPQS